MCTILMDQEFDKVTNLLPNMEVNTTAAHKHISGTIKEYAWGTRAMLPFAHLLKLIVINLIYWTCLWLNAWWHLKLVLTKETHVTQTTWDKHAFIAFSKYVEAHVEPDVTNALEACTFTGVYCGPTGNIQGACKVFDVLT